MNAECSPSTSQLLGRGERHAGEIELLHEDIMKKRLQISQEILSRTLFKTDGSEAPLSARPRNRDNSTHDRSTPISCCDAYVNVDSRSSRHRYNACVLYMSSLILNFTCNDGTILVLISHLSPRISSMICCEFKPSTAFPSIATS